jgi:hypothetical protein
MAKYLSVHEVAELTKQVAGKIRISTPAVPEISAALSKKGSTPHYISDGYKQLWVEKLYVAYSTIDDPNVYYAYVTDKHISEEDQSYEYVSDVRGITVNLPKGIRDQFKFALQVMIEDNTNYAVLENV